MKERKSNVNNKFDISHDFWVVSVLNSGESRLHLGHSMLVVEGLSGEGLFVGQYDILAKDISGEMRIHKVRCFEFDEYKNPIPYATLPSSSWHAEPENVCNMIKAIKEDKEQTEKANKGESEYIKYSFVGQNHFLFKFFQENNINCADWCVTKLKIAIPNLEYRGTAKPKLLAGLFTGADQERIEDIKGTMPESGCNIF